MSGRLRIGLVGAGGNTRARHIPGFRALPGVELTAVVNSTRASSEAAARATGIPRVADHWRELVESSDVDAVCIGTWPYLHAEVAVAALRAGKHVLTEARMAATAEEAEAMRNALAEAQAINPGIVAQIVPSPITLPWDRTVGDILAAGTLGRISDVTIAHLHGAYLDPELPVSWRQRRELSGVNTLSLGIYYEAVLRWLQDDAAVVSATAATVTAWRKDGNGAPVRVDVPDRVSVDGVFSSGARLRCDISAVESAHPRNEIVLSGDRGELRLDPAEGRLLMRAGSDGWTEPAPDRRDGWRVEADFVDSIRAGVPVRLTDFETGVRYMRFTEQAWRAWQA